MRAYIIKFKGKTIWLYYVALIIFKLSDLMIKTYIYEKKEIKFI